MVAAAHSFATGSARFHFDALSGCSAGVGWGALAVGRVKGVAQADLPGRAQGEVSVGSAPGSASRGTRTHYAISLRCGGTSPSWRQGGRETRRASSPQDGPSHNGRALALQLRGPVVVPHRTSVSTLQPPKPALHGSYTRHVWTPSPAMPTGHWQRGLPGVGPGMQVALAWHPPLFRSHSLQRQHEAKVSGDEGKGL